MDSRLEVITLTPEEIPDNPGYRFGYETALEHLRDRHIDGRGDPHYSNAAAGLLIEMRTDELVQKELIRAKMARPHDRLIYIADIAIKSINKGHEDMGDKVYPYNVKGIPGWRKLFRAAFHEDEHNALWNIMNRENQKNEAFRYLIAKLAPVILPERVAKWGSVKIADLGASRRHGLNALSLENTDPDQFSFEDIEVSSDGFDEAKPVFKRDPEITELFNRKVTRRPLEMGRSIGFDVWSLYNRDNFHWVISCCYPSEFPDADRRDRIRILDQEQPGVDFAQADCTSAAEMNAALNGSKVHLGIASLAFNQMSDEEIEKTIKAFDEISVDDAVLMVLDVNEPNNLSPNGLWTPEGYLYSEDRPYGFNMLIWDKTNKEAGFQKLMRFENGACRKGIINREHPLMQKLFAD